MIIATRHDPSRQHRDLHGSCDPLVGGLHAASTGHPSEPLRTPLMRLRKRQGGGFSKYPPAEPGALGLEPLEAAYPCRFNSAAPPAPRNASTSYVETIRLTSLLGRQACITAPQSSASAFKPSIDAIPFVCLAARRGATMERGASTAGYVKLLLPPRQSR
jgi:hypothetical protein